MKKIKEILLVDDSKGTNTLNKRLLLQMDVVENVSTALNGQIAMDYLTTKNEHSEYPDPEIIFLDINMPVMDGYQFLEEYEKLEINMHSNKVIIMLTTSVNEIDIKRATNYKTVKGYQFKPLSKERIMEVINQFL